MRSVVDRWRHERRPGRWKEISKEMLALSISNLHGRGHRILAVYVAGDQLDNFIACHQQDPVDETHFWVEVDHHNVKVKELVSHLITHPLLRLRNSLDEAYLFDELSRKVRLLREASPCALVRTNRADSPRSWTPRSHALLCSVPSSKRRHALLAPRVAVGMVH